MTGRDFQSSSSKMPPIRIRTLFLACTVLALAISELLRIYLAEGSSSTISRFAFVTLCVALIPYFSFREWSMAILAGAMAVGLLLQNEIGAILLALDRAAFFAAFIYLVTLLKEAAQRSRSVLDLGVYLTRQPQGRRYFSIAIGGHVMGVLLNFGAISLLTPLIQRGAKEMALPDGAAPNAEQLERQQISALLRGFSWMIMWAPTALTQAVLFTSFPDAQASKVIPLGLGASVLMISIGRILDRLTWRHIPPVATGLSPIPPRASFLRFSLISAVLVTLTFTLAYSANVSAAIGLMLVAPVVMVGWIFAQQIPAPATLVIKRSQAAFSEIFIRSSADPARSAFILGVAGFVGQAAAELAPVSAFATWLNLESAPAWVFLAALPALITLGGQLALSPIMVVVFLSAVINELPALPADPSLIVFALGAGWALSMTASPNASATLLIAAVTKIAPTTLTWRWNGAYALVSYLSFVALFFIVTVAI